TFPFSALFSFFFLFGHPRFASAEGTSDGSEQWGYVEVGPGAHLFWWLYRSPYRIEDPSKPWPLLLWHHGGPGASGVGCGNFREIGPLDENLQPPKFTWLRKADLLFVDSPVATGFSYVENESLVVKTDHEAAVDLTTLLIELFNGNETIQKSPLYVFAESYGGKLASALGVTALRAIEAGKLKARLGDSNFCLVTHSVSAFCSKSKLSWGPILRVISRIDENDLNQSNSLALKIQQQLAEGKSEDATGTFLDLGQVILKYSNNVSNSAVVKEGRSSSYRYTERTSTGAGSADSDFGSFMIGPIRKKLKIIPDNVTWQGQFRLIFPATCGDSLKPRIEEVGTNLSVDSIPTRENNCLDMSTKGAEAWLSKLKWDGLSSFLSEDRAPLYCGKGFTGTKGFVRSHRNLFFYWILGAGHMPGFCHSSAEPSNQPSISLQTVGSITQSPNQHR
ncbi:hypothetical protein EUGRSUZ_K02423, partial [Eucalyptus grandis]